MNKCGLAVTVPLIVASGIAQAHVSGASPLEHALEHVWLILLLPLLPTLVRPLLRWIR